MPATASFQQVLQAAIDDLVEHGFDSMERLAQWTQRLRDAASSSVGSVTDMDKKLKEGLAAIYRRLIERGEFARNHRGIERFTLERVRPALRAELDRRIMASANLIKLNRAEAIEMTIRRFQGWATSIRAGGTEAASKRETKREVRKKIAGLPYVERRVLIDQGHKLTASLNDILAKGGGAIAGRWRSRWRQPGYDYREDHKERDGLTYLVRGSWAHEAGLVKPGEAGFYDRVTAVGEEVNCRCSMAWLYNLRDLPAEMLTAKGRQALSSAQGLEEVRSARMARADAVHGVDHPDPEVQKSWATLKVEVVYAPRTGLIKPWEVHGVFTYPHPKRVHWASYKTEEAANKAAEAHRKKYARSDAAKTVTVGGAERSVTVARQAAANKDRIVRVKVSAFDPAFQRSGADFYVPPGGRGGGAIEGRYDRVKQYIAENKSFEASEVGVLANGQVGFINGRHRYAVLRDAGVAKIPVSMDRESIKNARKLGILADDEGGLQDKEDVGYVGPYGEKPLGQRCDLCTMFRGYPRCSAVAGEIDPGGWCRIFDEALVLSCGG